MLDEVSIKHDLIYRTNTEEIIGCTNLNETCNYVNQLGETFRPDTEAIPLATHILQFMIQGLILNIHMLFSLVIKCHLKYFGKQLKT